MIDIATIIGFVLFSISEVLGIMPVGPNGILHSIFLAWEKLFGNLENDIAISKDIIAKIQDLEENFQGLEKTDNTLSK